MPETHGLGSWYWHTQRYPSLGDGWTAARVPVTELAQTYEIEEPFRTGSGRAFRLWPTRWAVVVGRWARGSYVVDEPAHLFDAMQGRPATEITAAEIGEW